MTVHLMKQGFEKTVLRAAAKIKSENKYVHSYGVELEGGVSATVVDKIEEWLEELGLAHRFECGSDGSVSVPPPIAYDGIWLDNAEIRFWVETERIEILLELVVKLWRCGFRQNSSCGNHIHLKFFNNLYTISLIFNERFIGEFQRKYTIYARRREKKYGKKYLDRINNRYCSFINELTRFSALRAYQYSRYYAVNFVSVDEQETLEIRIFPHCTTALEYIENLVWLNRVINKLIDKFTKMKRLAVARVAFPEEEIEEIEEVIL